MHSKAKFLIIVLALALPLFGQSAKLAFDLDHLAKIAAESVTVTLDKSLIIFASKLLSDRDPEQARIKKLLEGLDGVYVRSFEFDKEGAYSKAEVDNIRKQLTGPGWKRLVEVRERGGDQVDVFVRQEADKIFGLAVVASEARELTVVNIVGTITPEQLSDLQGIAGIPRIGALERARREQEKQKDKDKADKKKDDEL